MLRLKSFRFLICEWWTQSIRSTASETALELGDLLSFENQTLIFFQRAQSQIILLLPPSQLPSSTATHKYKCLHTPTRTHTHSHTSGPPQCFPEIFSHVPMHQIKNLPSSATLLSYSKIKQTHLDLLSSRTEKNRIPTDIVLIETQRCSSDSVWETTWG